MKPEAERWDSKSVKMALWVPWTMAAGEPEEDREMLEVTQMRPEEVWEEVRRSDFRQAGRFSIHRADLEGHRCCALGPRLP